MLALIFILINYVLGVDCFSFLIIQNMQVYASFLRRISSVNVTKSAGNCGFGHIY